MSETFNRQLWRYDANQEGLLTGTFFATEQDIADVAGLAFDHPELGVVLVEPDDFALVASDYIGDDDTRFIDEMIVRGAVAGFDPILWMSAHALSDAAGLEPDPDARDWSRVDEDDDGDWGYPKTPPWKTEITVTPVMCFAFDCPECGESNLVQSDILEIDDARKRELEEANPDVPSEEWKAGDWAVCPDEIECAHCGAVIVQED